MYKYFIMSFILVMVSLCCVNLQVGEAFGILIFAKLGSMLRIYIYLSQENISGTHLCYICIWVRR